MMMLQRRIFKIRNSPLPLSLTLLLLFPSHAFSISFLPSISPLPASGDGLKSSIASFYDKTSSVWEKEWGEHMHHGYYNEEEVEVDEEEDGTTTTEVLRGRRRRKHRFRRAAMWREKRRVVAQERMIERLLVFGGVFEENKEKEKEKEKGSRSKWRRLGSSGRKVPFRFLDVGCGIGGSSRYLWKRLEAKVLTEGVGITLSPYQANRADELTSVSPSAGFLSFFLTDAHHVSDCVFPSPSMGKTSPMTSFDLVWSLESMEHMEDKRKVFQEMANVCSGDGGKVLVAAWCIGGDGKGLTRKEGKLLSFLSRCYRLPKLWSTEEELRTYAEKAGLQDIKTADWTKHVAPFWPEVILSSLRPKNVLSIMLNPSLLAGAIACPAMLKAQRDGLVRFVVLAGTKVGKDAKDERTGAAQERRMIQVVRQEETLLTPNPSFLPGI